MVIALRLQLDFNFKVMTLASLCLCHAVHVQASAAMPCPTRGHKCCPPPRLNTLSPRLRLVGGPPISNRIREYR